MKTKNIKFSLIIILLFFFNFIDAIAQVVPNKISYQAVVRNASNNLLSNQVLGIKLSIWQGSITGTLVYEEVQTGTTNINGLLSLQIGSGTVTSGNLNAIYWQEGPYFIKSEIDPTGGTNYTIISSSELISVPFSLHSKSTSSVEGFEGFVPKFVSPSKVGVSSIYYNNDKIGINTTSPQANLEIKGGNIGSFYTAQPTLTVANETTDYFGTNIFQLKSSVNSDYNAIKFAMNNGEINSGIVAFTNYFNLSKEMYVFVKDFDNSAQIKLSETSGIQIGKNSSYLKKINFSNITVGSSATQKKVINYIYPNSEPTEIIANITLKQEGSFSDVFSVSTTNFTTTGFDIVVYRIDGSGWGQNLQAAISIINK